MSGYIYSENKLKNIDIAGYQELKIKGQINASMIYYIVKSLSYNVSINLLDKLNNYYKIIYSKIKFVKYENNIKYIQKTDDNYNYLYDYVYDLETEVGNFQAGIGSMIVKNTDSVFFSPKIHNIETKEIQTDKEALRICIELGKLAGDAICKILPEPEEQVYEKTLWPFVIITKKRYVGNLYEDDDSHFHQKSMGIVLKRRDNAKIVKIVVGGIINYILNGGTNNNCSTNSIQDRNLGAINYTKTLIKKILRGEYPIDKFIVSKTLKSQYKDRTRIVHAILADRIGERDPGNKPNTNDRIPYVYVIPKGKVLLQGDRVEDPKYVIDNELELDYLFYITNQIMKPSLQFLELIAVNPKKLFDNYINKEINRRKKISSIMDYVCVEDNNSEINSEINSENNNENNNESNNESKNNKIVKKNKSNKSNKFSLTIEL